MKANFTIYKHADSCARIREILASSDYEYKEKDSVPHRDSLTFTNGYYVQCSAMFVDMRGSKDLAAKHQRPTLARIYRAFISELVALLRGITTVREVMIEGDCVWGIFDTKLKTDIDELFEGSARVMSFINNLNWYFSKRNISPICVGVGMDYGRALMIKGGYRGSGINEVVWMGDVIGSAAKLCGYGGKTFSDECVMLSETVHGNLSDKYKHLTSWNSSRNCYHANIINTEMGNWLSQQCAK